MKSGISPCGQGEASRNTAELIDGTVKRVREGSELVGKTGMDFHQVKESVTRFRELVGEIAAASQEQARGINQIGKAVSDMEGVVQQNAANAEEAASASEEMHAQAEQLKTFVQDLASFVGGSDGQQQGAAVTHRRALPAAVKGTVQPRLAHTPKGKDKSNGKDHTNSGRPEYVPGPAISPGRAQIPEF